MTDTVNLGLPCIEGSQAQKHITHNDALRILDALVQLAVLDRDLTVPPGSPSEGQRWIVKAGATGAWAGHDNAVAGWQDGAWLFSVPKTGWIAFVIDEGTLLVWNGSAWGDFFSTVTSIQNLARLGLGTTADATNPLSAKLNNALFAAKTVAEGGDGNLRFALNKESVAKSLSFLFQDNYSGRAEIGLTGDDNFHFKVSPDGSTWYEGIKIDRATGKVSFPASGGPRETLTADRTYYVRTDGNDGNTGLANTSGGAFLTWQHAIDVVHDLLDLGGYNVVIQAGGSSGTFIGGISVIGPFVGAKSRTSVQLIGDNTTPTNFLLQTSTSASVIAADGSSFFAVKGFQLKSTGGGALIDCLRGAAVLVNGAMDFSTTSSNHLFARRQGYIEITASYTISGGTGAHFSCNNNSTIIAAGLTITLTGTPNFSNAFASSTATANIGITGNTYSGSATGKLYNVTLNAIVNSGVTLPGSVAGTTATGGQYI